MKHAYQLMEKKDKEYIITAVADRELRPVLPEVWMYSFTASTPDRFPRNLLSLSLCLSTAVATILLLTGFFTFFP